MAQFTSNPTVQWSDPTTGHVVYADLTHDGPATNNNDQNVANVVMPVGDFQQAWLVRVSVHAYGATAPAALLENEGILVRHRRGLELISADVPSLPGIRTDVWTGTNSSGNGWAAAVSYPFTVPFRPTDRMDILMPPNEDHGSTFTGEYDIVLEFDVIDW